jgi:putative ABC transport system ATP-binding protein
MTGQSTVLQFQDVGKSFATPQGPLRILRHVELSVERGEFVMITGPSGSGKTTLLNLAGLLDGPSEGRVVFEGRDASGLPEEELCRLRAERIGAVFQRFALLPRRSVLENVLFRFRYCKGPAGGCEEMARQALADMGLEAALARKARLLSHGEMQRVAIARAVVMPPALLLADEPTGNLDGDAARAVMDCFQRLHAKGLTIVMVTHNQALLPCASRRLLCREGTLVAT